MRPRSLRDGRPFCGKVNGESTRPSGGLFEMGSSESALRRSARGMCRAVAGGRARPAARARSTRASTRRSIGSIGDTGRPRARRKGRRDLVFRPYKGRMGFGGEYGEGAMRIAERHRILQYARGVFRAPARRAKPRSVIIMFMTPEALAGSPRKTDGRSVVDGSVRSSRSVPAARSIRQDHRPSLRHFDPTGLHVQLTLEARRSVASGDNGDGARILRGQARRGGGLAPARPRPMPPINCSQRSPDD